MPLNFDPRHIQLNNDSLPHLQVTNCPIEYAKFLQNLLLTAALASVPHHTFGAGQTSLCSLDSQGRRVWGEMPPNMSIEQFLVNAKSGVIAGLDTYKMLDKLTYYQDLLFSTASTLGIVLEEISRFSVEPPHQSQEVRRLFLKSDNHSHQNLQTIGEEIQDFAAKLLTGATAFVPLPSFTLSITNSGINELSDYEIAEIESLCAQFPTMEKSYQIFSKGCAAPAEAGFVKRALKDGAHIFRIYENIDGQNPKLLGFMSLNVIDSKTLLNDSKTFELKPSTNGDLGFFRVAAVAPDAPPQAYLQLLYSATSYMYLQNVRQFAGLINVLNRRSLIRHIAGLDFSLTPFQKEVVSPAHGDLSFVVVTKSTLPTRQHVPPFTEPDALSMFLRKLPEMPDVMPRYLGDAFRYCLSNVAPMTDSLAPTSNPYRDGLALAYQKLREHLADKGINPNLIANGARWELKSDGETPTPVRSRSKSFTLKP